MRVLIACGGTGGHIYPGLAIAEELLDKKLCKKEEILFCGTSKSGGLKVILKEGYDLCQIRACGLGSFRPDKAIGTFFENLKGFLRSFPILKGFRPDVVIGLGGYSSFGIALASFILRIPLLICEQNSIPGRANRFLAFLAKKVAVAYPGAKDFFPAKKVVLTGNPVRRDLGKIERKEARRYFGLKEDEPVLLLFGGSQGAHRLNEAMVEAYEHLGQVRIIWVSGPPDYNWVKGHHLPKGVILRPYLDEMPEAYAAADLIIARAGATSIAEITALGLPSILIPYPYATANHQQANASFLEEHGAARIILDKELKGEVLVREIRDLLKDRETLRKMSEASLELGKILATKDITPLILEVARR
ncbi:undecaprenyldiphospho-muramoylpentapeptide beta-N-acetylglucosaminyltransferase [bacterium]|nr:undecaprenyldiphospho-muramoylpentapeptide beta-N-acetylglucosaminyltransferase [bacterium]